MPLPYYVSPEQMMKDKAEYARKGISRGKAIVTIEYRDGVLLVAENPSTLLHKISEIYDRIAFAGVGKYNEFENLRVAGVRHADVKGYSYSRGDVSAKSLANAYSQALGNIFTQDIKPFEVEVLVVEVGDANGTKNEIYHILYDGTIEDEKNYAAMGGQSEEIRRYLKDNFQESLDLAAALKLGVRALMVTQNKTLTERDLEVAVLDRTKERRKFRRIPAEVLHQLLDRERLGDVEAPFEGFLAPGALPCYPEVHMKRRIFGLENEYGLTCTLNGQRRLSPDNVARYLFEKVIPGARNANVFLENGARLYLDTGFHPEYATPECDDIVDLVIHDKAGERIVEDLLHQAEKRLREDGISGHILLFKNNTDSAGNSYGCHENYLVSRDVSFQRLAEGLIPFFVTRQIFAGAGKVLQTPRGFHYCLSQRAQHICQEISGATTSSRSIINTRDEPHADAEKYRRLHVIVGDSNMSEVATYLKVGTTALILDMIEDGHFDRDYSLQSPVQAIRDISHDPTLRETIRLKDGRAITPLQLQMEYLEHATRYVQAIDADPVTRDVLARWTYVIEQLADDPMQLNREIDWVIKQQLIQAYMEKNRLSWRDPKVSLMDLQYHDIRPDKGLYFSLVRRDLVDRITDDESIERAKHVPPQTTRARLRGEFIRQANLKGKDYRVDWVYLKLNDPERETILCKDPFQSHDERVERLIRSF